MTNQVKSRNLMFPAVTITKITNLIHSLQLLLVHH